MRVKPIELSESERDQLQRIIKKGSDWQEREEGAGSNHFAALPGESVVAIAEQQGVKHEAIRERRRK